MSKVRPFKGIRPAPAYAKAVASLPYDVISSEEAREMAAGNPHSFLHVVKAEIDLPRGADAHSDQVYQLSADNLAKMREEGILITDDRPCFYIYRLKMGEHTQTGLVVGASVDEYEAGTIKKHELTRRDKEDDRARHVQTLKANAGPVLCTYRARPEIHGIVYRIMSAADPVCDFEADDGIGHTLWVVSDPVDTEAIRRAFETVEALYIADGHHRTASAFRARETMKERNPAHTGDEEYNYFLAVLFPDDELRIMGYHRVVKDLNGLSESALLARVAEKFDVEQTGRAEPESSHEFGMYLGGQWYRLKAKKGTYPEQDPIRGLDVSILQENLLALILGIKDPRTDTRIDCVGGIRGIGELERRCGWDAKVAFALAPVSVEQLMAIADNNEIMPPKSTWFEPKLRSGMVVKSIEE